MMSEKSCLGNYCILFADIKGFSTFTRFQQRQYIEQVLSRIGESIWKKEHKPEQTNTWGDGIVAFFQSVTNAVQCALTLRDTFRNTLWENDGLPNLTIRISLHIGEVYVGLNPVTNKDELIGTEINRAARLEPIVIPNHVYSTKIFAEYCKSNNVEKVKFKSLGKIPLAKDWGEEEIYVIFREHESINTDEIKRLMESDYGISIYPASSKFGSRIKLSKNAKLTIAEYCTKSDSDFWNSEDIVFIESGTLPVYMIQVLYRDRVRWPKLLITNNIACSTVRMMGQLSKGLSHQLVPEDIPTECILMGGRVLDDYAATIPEDLIDIKDGGLWQSNKITDYFTKKGVNHIIMMVTKLTKKDGPCANSSSMQRFKKLLLKYVFENPKVRFSILAEAEKIACERSGWSADDIDLPGLEYNKYWENVLSNGRVNFIAAISPEMTPERVEIAKREIIQLKKAGASCVLLDINGKEI
ncbi:MAG: adenylate/guanylate cyclase domain-containing protein [Acidobacteria bacterium]|nr:adenylate/guanylate cyclase domain-containing protein [Acidobacteriota bacterium]